MVRIKFAHCPLSWLRCVTQIWLLLALMLWLGLPFDIPTSSMVSCLISDDLTIFPTQVPPETSTHASAAWASFFFSGGNLIALGRLHSSTLLYTHPAINHFMRPSMTHGHKFRSVLFVLPQVPSTDAAAVRLSFSAWRSSSGVGAWLHQSWSDVCRWLPRTQTSSPLAQAQKGKSPEEAVCNPVATPPPKLIRDRECLPSNIASGKGAA